MCIEIKNISKKYGDKTVIDNFSATIPANKITAFIGPNGAGKSTVLSIISRLLQPTSGEILLNGDNLSLQKTSEIAKKLAVLKQSNHIQLRLTIEELVAFGRFPYSKGRLSSEDKKHIQAAIHYLQLDEIAHRHLDELSGGQRQRAYIAMVLAQNTDVILLDEPLNNLDMKNSVQIMQVLRRLVDEENKTIVVVIHDINFASCYADYIITMKQGKMIHCAPVENIMNPQTLEDVFDFPIPIQEINQNRYALYFK